MTTATAFRHAAMFYSGLPHFVASIVPFLRQGIDLGEPILVVVDHTKIEALRDELGADSARVEFADMAFVGRNPARIIPAWQQFVGEHLAEDKPVRGVGEPIWAGRSPDELIECQAHETLLNVAFGAGPGWSLLCPYDTETLSGEVMLEARRSHPLLTDAGLFCDSAGYLDAHPSPARLDHPLPPAPAGTEEFTFGDTGSFAESAGSLRLVRRRAADFAAAAGLDRTAVDRLRVAISEIATNSLRYGGGRGVLRQWSPAPAHVICEISDAGHITGPALLGRQAPTFEQRGGRGLWLANQFCDLVQIRSSEQAGTTVRLHVRS